MQNDCDYSAGACYSPAGSDKICFVNFLIQRHVADIMMEVALFADVTGLATAVEVCTRSLKVRVRLTSIWMLGGSVCEGVCIAAGITVVGGCEQTNEKGVRGGGA
jgi:hypothetical protein